MFSTFIEKLIDVLNDPLPGKEAHLQMFPPNRKTSLLEASDAAKQSAVLIILYPAENKKVYTLFIERPIYDGVHSGQIAFPGGRFEEEDQSLERTALREANEEIGILPENVTVLSALTPVYISPSNFLVTPYLAYTPSLGNLSLNKREVEKVVYVSLADLIDESIITIKKVNHSSGLKIETPCFDINGTIIWGATAMMLSELKAILKKMDSISF